MDNRPTDLGALFRELKRRKVFRATALYAVAAWVVVEVAETTLPYLLFPEWTITLVIVLALVGFPITIVLSWAFDVRPARAVESGAAEPEPVARPRWRLLPASLASLAVVIAGAGLFILFLHPASGESFEGRDWILIPEFENQTGDATFDGTLAAALRTGIKQSRFVNVVDPRRIAQAREGSGAEAEESATREATLELAARLGSTAVLFGRIRPEGQGFAISAEIVDPLSGKPMRRTLAVTAARRETVLVALDVLAGRIRRALGETAEEIEAGAVEIPVATTSSLQALKSWVEGSRAWREGRYAEAVRLFQLAVEEDSAFALAHAALGGYGSGPEAQRLASRRCCFGERAGSVAGPAIRAWRIGEGDEQRDPEFGWTTHGI